MKQNLNINKGGKKMGKKGGNDGNWIIKVLIGIGIAIAVFYFILFLTRGQNKFVSSERRYSYREFRN